jgi:hypothetical protein
MDKTNDYIIMPYPIKNSATLQTNSIKLGSFGIGVNQGGYGLTSSTAFWNGKTPNVSGYVLYIGNGTSSPTTYVAKNDNDLIALSNVLGYGPNTTIGETLTTFNGNDTLVICVNMDSQNIVTSGLTLYLDAGYTPSYPKVGTKWQNLSGTAAITGSLTNGPTFNSDFYGSIVFDGSDDYVGCGNVAAVQSLSQITMSVWVKFLGLDYVGSTGELVGLMSKGYPDLSSPNTGFWFAYDNRSNGSSFTYTCFGNSNGGFAGGVNNFSSKSYIFTNNVWYNITATVNSSSQGTLYINGAQQGSSVTFSNLSIPNIANELYVGRIDVPGYSINGSIMQAQLYNRALSAAEVLQNYYAGLQRFIPTNGLVLWLDGTNTNTRVITPTTAIDMSGNDYNGAFINGTTLNHRDGGTVFNFDGTNDYINVAHDTSQNLTSQGTISSWINPAILTQGWYAGIVAKNTGGAVNQQSYTLSWRQVSGGILGQICNGDGTYNEVYASFPTVANVWYNIVFTWNGSQLVMYNNGVVAGTTTQTINNQILSTDITIGGYTYKGAGGGDEYFNGKIGDVRIYNRGLTATEVLTIYTAGRSRYGL